MKHEQQQIARSTKIIPAVIISIAGDATFPDSLYEVWKWAETHSPSPTLWYLFDSRGLHVQIDFDDAGAAMAFTAKFGGKVVTTVENDRGPPIGSKSR